MSSRIDELFEQAAKLEHEVERELNTARDRWHYRIESGRIRFEQDVRTAHKRLRHSIPKYLSESNLLTVLVSPVIYSLVIPIAILDLWVTVYQWACFPVYDVDRVRRSTYVVFDRQHLAYLNAIEKVNCLYCAYANGVFAYVREVAGRTEQVPGVRFATRDAYADPIRTIGNSSSTATRRGTRRSCLSCGRACTRTESTNARPIDSGAGAAASHALSASIRDAPQTGSRRRGPSAGDAGLGGSSSR